jgi:hypothetical protein
MAALAVAALGVVAPAAASAKTVTVTPGSNSFYVQAPRGEAYLLKGEKLRIKLRPADSGSTGYHWRVSKVPARRLLRLVSAHRSRTGKFQVFTYRARRRVGETDLQFKYMPPGRHRRAADTVDLSVAVNRHPPKYGCHPKGSETVARNGKVRVFKIQRSVIEFHSRQRYTAYYGCELRKKRAYLLDNFGPDRPDNASQNDYSTFRLRGTKVAYVFRKECPFARDCTDQSYRYVESQSLHTGRMLRSVPVRIGPAVNGVSDIVLTRSGGLAWIENDAYKQNVNLVIRSDQPPKRRGRIAHDDTILDFGEDGYVAPQSLERDGGDVTWVHAGARRRATLR